MAVSMLKTKKPFDLLANWKDYVNAVTRHFSENEEPDVWVPNMDVTEKEGKYVVRVDLPGVSEKDIRVLCRNGHLKISGSRRKEVQKDGELSHMNERLYGRFERVLQFDLELNENEIEKDFKNGILELKIPIP